MSGSGGNHLRGDEEKVLGSEVQHPYLVHFSRSRSRRQPATEALVTKLGRPIKAAYVHHDLDAGTVAIKRLNDAEIAAPVPRS